MVRNADRGCPPRASPLADQTQRLGRLGGRPGTFDWVCRRVRTGVAVGWCFDEARPHARHKHAYESEHLGPGAEPAKHNDSSVQVAFRPVNPVPTRGPAVASPRGSSDWEPRPIRISGRRESGIAACPALVECDQRCIHMQILDHRTPLAVEPLSTQLVRPVRWPLLRIGQPTVQHRREQVWPDVVQNLSFRVGVPVFRHEVHGRRPSQVFRSMRKSLSSVVNPSGVHTSVVKKSLPAPSPHCVRKNVRHEVGRPGAGRLPWSLRTVPVVLAATRCPSVLSAP